MNRDVPRYSRILILAGALLVVASIAWGTASVPRSASRHAGATVRKTAAHVTPAGAARLAAHARVPKSPSTAHKTTAAANTAPAAGEAGMRIFKDPETGQVGPPTAENAAILAREAPVEIDRANLPVIKLAQGGIEVLTGQIEDAVVVKIDSRGHRVFTCTTDPKAALKTPAAPAPAPREDR